MSWETWAFAVNVTLPNLLMLLLGVVLRRTGLINDHFCTQASRLIFNVTLPCLLFLSIALYPSPAWTDLSLVLYGGAGVLFSFLLMEWLAVYVVSEKRERGIFVQGAFRSNMAIVGLAYCINAYGAEGAAIAALYMSVSILLYNVLSVVTLTRSLQHDGERGGLGGIVHNIIFNPLIISILLGLLCSLSQLSMPVVIEKSANQLAGVTLPLALLCSGASLNFGAMRDSSYMVLTATVAKLLVIPVIITFGGWLLGFRGASLGVIFLLNAVPTAAASYPMTRTMGGNSTLAANIIALTMMGSFFTTATGLYLLRSWGVI